MERARGVEKKGSRRVEVEMGPVAYLASWEGEREGGRKGELEEGAKGGEEIGEERTGEIVEESS